MFLNIFQFLADLDALGAMLFAFAAADTVIGGGGVLSGSTAHKVLLQSCKFALGG